MAQVGLVGEERRDAIATEARLRFHEGEVVGVRDRFHVEKERAHREGALRDRSWRIPVWVFRTLVSLAILVVVGLLAGVAFYVPLTQAAIRVPGLERRVAELEAENSRIGVLAEALDSAEARYVRIRELLGVEATGVGARTAPVLPVAPAIMRDDAWWMLGTSIALYPLMIRGMKLSRVEGGVLFGIYLVYISLLLR